MKAVTARKIIVKAFYLTGEFSPQTKPAEHEVNEALELLNDLLASYSANSLLIPYRRKLVFTLTQGKAVYTFSREAGADVVSDRIATLSEVSIVRHNVTYPVSLVDSDVFYSSTRYLLTQSIPQYVLLQNTAETSTLEFFPIPDSADTCWIIGKFILDGLELDDRLDEVPPYYNRFLRYALARELCNIYETGNWDQNKESTYRQLESTVISSNDIDISVKLGHPIRGNIYWGPGRAN